jgi:hypothetical protein
VTERIFTIDMQRTTEGNRWELGVGFHDKIIELSKEVRNLKWSVTHPPICRLPTTYLPPICPYLLPICPLSAADLPPICCPSTPYLPPIYPLSAVDLPPGRCSRPAQQFSLLCWLSLPFPFLLLFLLYLKSSERLEWVPTSIYQPQHASLLCCGGDVDRMDRGACGWSCESCRLGFRVPLVIVNKALQANHLYPFAISLKASIRTYQQTLDKLAVNEDVR